MKSRISSFRIGKELWKKQLWLFALTCLMFFVLCTIAGMISMNIMAQNTGVTLAEKQTNFLEFFVPGRSGYGPSAVLSLFAAATIFVGTAAGISLFSYLHNKNKVDFYHAMPVSRTRLYLIQAGICLVDYLIPAIVFVNLLLVIGSIRGVASPAAWAGGWKMILAGLAFLIVCYTVSGLAMLLTGRLIVGCLGVWTFIIIGPVMATLKESWVSCFLKTYYSPTSLVEDPFWKYSPYAYPWNALLTMGRPALVISFVAGILLLGINLAIYRRRPSEAAGKSMAFSLPAAVIQIILTVLSSLMLGIFFGTIFATFSRGWFIFGLIFGGLLAYVTTQMIYIPSFKKLASGKLRLLVSAVIVIVIAAYSLFGLAGHDRKLPSQASIQYVGIECEGAGFYGPSKVTEGKVDMKLSCDDKVYAFLEKLASNHVYSIKDDPTRNYFTFCIRMARTNGKPVYRKFTVESDKIRKEEAELYSYAEFKKHLYPSLNVEDATPESLYFKLGDISSGIYDDRDIEKKKALYLALKEDVMNLTPETVSREIPLGEIECTVRDKSRSSADIVDYGEDISDIILIYPSFSKTLALLAGDGKEILTYPENIREINVYDLRKLDETGNYKKLANYKTPEDIKKTLAQIIPVEFVTIWVETDPAKNVEVITTEDQYIDSRFCK